MTVAAIHQPNYLPWLGYFHKIKRADVFVLLDTVNYQSGNATSITNRTRIKGAGGVTLLTVPVSARTASGPITDVQIDPTSQWARKHLRSVDLNYRRAPHFRGFFEVLNAALSATPLSLAQLNGFMIVEVAKHLGLQTSVVWASDLGVQTTDRNQRLIELCRKVDATTYLSGHGARKYNDEPLLLDHGIRLTYTSFVHPEYSQLHGAFVAGLSTIDAIFNCGPAVSALL